VNLLEAFGGVRRLAGRILERRIGQTAMDDDFVQLDKLDVVPRSWRSIGDLLRHLFFINRNNLISGNSL